MTSGWTMVLDVGKTLAKASLWDDEGNCVANRSRANRLPSMGGGLTLDVGGIESWLEATLKEFVSLGPLRSIIPVAHGAAAAIIRNGRLQRAPLDYEWPGAALDRATYDRQRDPFKDTGSPALPAGLNLGVQLHWLECLRSSDFRSGAIVPWPQYWAWILCGETASEVTSLGCHTDLWRPFERRPSDLAIRRGWAERLAPVKRAGEVLGTVTPEWVERTGVSGRCEVYCGLHDSNAALLSARSHAELKAREVTVLSTGTWFVAMRAPAEGSASVPPLPEDRDCLVNVDATGAPVPSARFMGGREIELLIGAPTESTYIDEQLHHKRLIHHAVEAVQRGAMILPSAAKGVGPYPRAAPHSTVLPAESDATALAHLYAALIADVSLDLIGSTGTLVIDGRFSQEPVFVRALAGLRPQMLVLVSEDDNGVAQGALSLVRGVSMPKPALEKAVPLPVEMKDYRDRFRAASEDFR